MTTQLVFLGTAGDAETMGKQWLASGGIVLVDPQLQIHIDPGPGSMVKAAQYDVFVRDHDLILVSQRPLLHSGDLNALIEGMTLGGVDRKGVLLSSHAVVLDQDDTRAILMDDQKNHLERIIALRTDDKVGVGDFQIVPTQTTSDEHDVIGFKIVAQKYSVGYTAVTGYTKKIASQFKGVDILIYCMPSLNSIDDEVTEAAKFITDAKPKLAVITHFDARQARADTLDMARRIQKKSGVQTIVGKEGLSIDPNTHAAKVKQRSLQSFDANEK